MRGCTMYCVGRCMVVVVALYCCGAKKNLKRIFKQREGNEQ